MGLDEGLIEAARKGNIEKVRKLLKEGVDLNVKDENGKTLLHARYNRMNHSVVKVQAQYTDT